MNSITASNLILNVRSKPSFCVISSTYEFKKANISSYLKSVSPLYPNFDTWLNFKFLKNIDRGERRVIVAHDNDKILGVSLLKLTSDENKICTFYVSENGKRIGTELMKKSMESIDSERIIITVCSERERVLASLLNNSGFKLFYKSEGLYRQDSTEFFYSPL